MWLRVLAGNFPFSGRTQVHLFEFRECKGQTALYSNYVLVGTEHMEIFQHLTILGKRATMYKCQS